MLGLLGTRGYSDKIQPLMKKLTFLALLFCAVHTAGAQLASQYGDSDWEFVFENKLVKVYYIPANIKARGPYLEVMTMSDRRDPDDSGARSSLDIYVLSCRLGASRLAYMEDYSGHRLSGEMLSSAMNPDEKLYPTPPAMLELQRTVCRPF